MALCSLRSNQLGSFGGRRRLGLLGGLGSLGTSGDWSASGDWSGDWGGNWNHDWDSNWNHNWDSNWNRRAVWSGNGGSRLCGSNGEEGSEKEERLEHVYIFV